MTLEVLLNVGWRWIESELFWQGVPSARGNKRISLEKLGFFRVQAGELENIEKQQCEKIMVDLLSDYLQYGD